MTTTLDVGLQQIARDAIKSVLPPSGTGPTAALVVIDAHSGAVLAMVGGENYHKNQFNLATQGERQPGSSFKPFVLATALKENIAPSSVLDLAAGHDQRRRPALAGQQLRGRVARADRPQQGDRVLRQLGLLTADRDRRAAQRARHGEARSGSRRRCRATSRSASAPSRRRRSRWRAPTRRSPTAASASTARSSATSRASSARSRSTGRRQAEQAVAKPRADREPGGDRQPTCSQGVVQYGTGKAAQLPGRAGRRQDRHDRELRRRVVRRLHAAARRRRLGRLPRQARPDDDRVPRPPGRRRHLPGADLEGVHDEGARRSCTCRRRRSRRPTTATRRPSRSSTAAACSSATTASARTPYQLAVLRRRGPVARSRRASRTRSRSRRSIGQSLAARRRGSKAQPLTPAVVYKPAKTGERLGFVVGAVPARRAPRPRTTRSRSSCAKSLHGVVPNVVGLPLDKARGEARAPEARRCRSTGDSERQGGRAVGRRRTRPRRPALAITLTVNAERPAEEARAGEAVAPRAGRPPS